ncbi:MAG: co-chaperone DjlA [Xanthomonadales bacterium]|jgi:DnaJ like chaperone protein|nr:co-chaperone DjlA [Xanthomonadales bacterium]
MLLFILIGGLLGLVVGGVVGALLGAVVGGVAGHFLLTVLFGRGLGAIRAQFVESTFAVMGALCKADGRVTGDEIRVAEQFFSRLALSDEQRRSAMAAFNRGKSPDFDLDAELALLRASGGRSPALLQLFLQIQLSAIAADGNVHPEEHALLLRVARGLGLSGADVESLEALLRGSAAAGPDAGARRGSARLADAYATLGIGAKAGDAEVKKSYRRLMSRHHPDKLAARGMPENMRPMAEEKTREIRKAYDLIKEARGL